MSRPVCVLCIAISVGIKALGPASSTKDAGVMVQLAGKPYFLHVMVHGANGIDETKSIALAKAVVAGAK